MSPRQKQLDQFFNQTWHMGCWTLGLVLFGILVGFELKVMELPVPQPEPTAAAPAMFETLGY